MIDAALHILDAERQHVNGVTTCIFGDPQARDLGATPTRQSGDGMNSLYQFVQLRSVTGRATE